MNHERGKNEEKEDKQTNKKTKTKTKVVIGLHATEVRIKM